ncbi:MAG: FliA/WhiG family RNA polymerase sigma factor [Thermodesulfobacteriota bacterium]
MMSYAAVMHFQQYSDASQNRDKQIETYLPLVKRIVQRIACRLPSSVDIEDLYHAGILGLIQAIDHFNPAKENRLATYATFRIRGAVLSELRSRDVISRTNRRKVRAYDTTRERLTIELGRDPEPEEIAAAMGLGLDDLNAVCQQAAVSIVSLEEFGIEEGEEKDICLNALADPSESDPSEEIIRLQLKQMLSDGIRKLTQREQTVLSLYYVEELTLKEIGKVLDLTESRICQIHSQALSKLRQMLRKRMGWSDNCKSSK